jgi:hypothetical protein
MNNAGWNVMMVMTILVHGLGGNLVLLRIFSVFFSSV